MIAISSSGKSFKALTWYLANGRSGREQDRVAWAVGRNLPTSDPELAATFMRATAGRSDRVEKPVYHVALSFDPGDRVDRAAMERVAEHLLERLGLSEHQALIVAHQDRDHPHVHLLVNRIHPETGKAWERWQDRPVIQQVLREEERALGLREVAASLSPRETDPSERRSRVAQALELLATHQRVTGLQREASQARMETQAARIRVSEIDAAVHRAREAEDGFRRALAKVYREPDAARRAIESVVASRGITAAAATLWEHPERLGELIVVERSRALGLIRREDDTQARGLARSAGVKAREAFDARETLRGAEQSTASGQTARQRHEDRAREVEARLTRLPKHRELEARLARLLQNLVPREFERLRLLTSAPQLVLMKRIRAAAKDAVLGREQEN